MRVTYYNILAINLNLLSYLFLVISLKLEVCVGRVVSVCYPCLDSPSQCLLTYRFLSVKMSGLVETLRLNIRRWIGNRNDSSLLKPSILAL